MPLFASVEIPVIGRSRLIPGEPSGKGKAPNRRTYKPRTYDDKPLLIKPSENAPKSAQILGRIIDSAGVTYQLKIGDVEINDVGIDEILDYVSALDLEQFENHEFEEEREVLKTYEAEREKVKQEQIERLKERAKRKGVVVHQDVTATEDEFEGGEDSVGKHGRARPSYTHLFQKNGGRGRPRKDVTTSSSRLLSDEDGSIQSSEEVPAVNSSVGRKIEPFAELPRRRRRKRDKITGELLPLPSVAQPTALDKKRQQRRRHPLTGQLMPVGWRYDPNKRDDTNEVDSSIRSSLSFRKLSISQEHHSKRQKLEAESAVSRSPSPLPTKAELFARFSPNNIRHSKPKESLKEEPNYSLKHAISEDDSDVVEMVAQNSLKTAPKSMSSRRGNSSMLKSMVSSSAANSSQEPEPQTSILHPRTTHRPSESLRTSHAGKMRHSQLARTSILNPSAGRASSTDPPTRPSDVDDDSHSSLDDEEWFIEGIFGHHMSDPRTHPPEFGNKPVMLYQVKWEGYKEPTWEPKESFSDLGMLEGYRLSAGLASESSDEGADSDQDITAVPPAETYVPPRSSVHSTPNVHATPKEQGFEDTNHTEEMEEDEYDVESIIAHKLSDPRSHPPELRDTPVMLYRVRWKGYEETTWEPTTSFGDRSLLHAYKKRFGLPNVDSYDDTDVEMRQTS